MRSKVKDIRPTWRYVYHNEKEIDGVDISVDLKLENMTFHHQLRIQDRESLEKIIAVAQEALKNEKP